MQSPFLSSRQRGRTRLNQLMLLVLILGAYLSLSALTLQRDQAQLQAEHMAAIKAQCQPRYKTELAVVVSEGEHIKCLRLPHPDADFLASRSLLTPIRDF
jgi:hypothetical protein